MPARWLRHSFPPTRAFPPHFHHCGAPFLATILSPPPKSGVPPPHRFPVSTEQKFGHSQAPSNSPAAPHRVTSPPLSRTWPEHLRFVPISMRACPMRHFSLGSKLSQSSPRASSHRTVGSSWVYRWPPRGPRCQRTPTLNPSPPPHCQRTSPWAPFPHLLTRCTLRDSPILTQLTLGHLIHWLTNGDHAAAVT
jgi:hypothetical protein